ncbi:MAG: uroporphyrinogen-III synthase [Erythrobacter sp.]
MSYVLTVRPQPGLAATMAAGEAMGLNMIGYPLFEVRSVAWQCPDPATIDALLIGSANAIRHGGPALEKLKSKPVHAVGEVTADVAREAGFTVATTGAGGLQKVLDQITAPARLLRISGVNHVPLEVREGVEVTTVIAYDTVPMELPEPLRPLHDLGLTVLLHSAAAAEQFDRESRRLALERSRISLAAIGPRVASVAGEGWQAIHVSPSPNDRALLEMVSEMCI